MDSPEPQQSRFGIWADLRYWGHQGYAVKFWICVTITMSYFGQFEQISATLRDFGQIWAIWKNMCYSAILNKREQFWTILKKSVQLCSISDESVRIWAILNQSVQIYAILDKSVQLWTILDNFERICATLRDNGQFWTNLCNSVILDDFGKLK